MTKEEKESYRKGHRNADSDSEYSYRSVVSAGGTRHVKRRRKRADGTYSDEESYHSSQDEEGQARRRQRRRDREHGSDSEHSYFSVVSAGGTRHVRRRRRRADGTYSRSVSYHSEAEQSAKGHSDDDGEFRNMTSSEIGKRERTKNSSESSGVESDVSIISETSEGGTRRVMQRKRIRDSQGNIIGYGESKPVKKGTDLGQGSDRDMVAALEGLQQKRQGNLLRERTNDSLRSLRNEGELLVPPDIPWPGTDVEGKEQKILTQMNNEIPSDFSDATTDEDVDLSKMTPAQRRQYYAERERKRKEREARRREKYGDKYDEIMKKKMGNKTAAQLEKDLALKKAEEREKESRRMSMTRRTSNASVISRGGGRPKSMVTYDKGPPRDLGYDNKKDNREIGMAHDSWSAKTNTDHAQRRRGSASSEGGEPPKLHRETTMLKTLPTIPQGKIYEEESEETKPERVRGKLHGDNSDDNENSSTKDKDEKQKEEEEEKKKKWPFEVGADGKMKLRGKKIDLSALTDDDLRKLGIDPTWSAKEIAKHLKKMFGNDVQILQDGTVIGTKGVHEYDPRMTDEELSADPNLDLDTLTGLRRVNIIMRRGGEVLQRHLERVISLSKLVDKYAKDLDEKDADIDFLSHYRLVDPSRIEGYARAFVVEDSDLDTVLNSHETKVALDGVASIQHMTNKQMDYVMRVLKIDEATMITFRMFAVVTALCERVTHMDSLSQRLLEICNLADIERKLDLYKAMFYTNTQSDRDPNFIKNEALKIELIAGGLNWKQQEYILEKMEPNDWGEISFLDYMCYIPLFLSMHDNICNNPLDMSNEKYQSPIRQRAASVQRDMNPLGCNLKKESAFMVRKKAMEMMQGSQNNAVQVSRKYMDILNKYTSDRYNTLRKVDEHRQTSMQPSNKENSSSSISNTSKDLIY